MAETPAPEPVMLPLCGGTETILVVEDEAFVCEFVKRLLRESGCEVLTAASGTEALEVWSRERQRMTCSSPT